MQTTLDTATTQTLYIPPKCFSLDTLKQAQIRLFLQGDGGTGKTWSALTFPNPIILSTDRGAGAHTGRKDVHEAPFHDINFVRSICPDSNGVLNIKEALPKWIKNEATKLTENQTLVIDNLTGIDRAFHAYATVNPMYSSSTGKKDERIWWQLKIPYYGELFTALKALKCNVVFIGHETNDRGKDGEFNGKIRALLSGQVGDSIKNEFTDYVRQLTCDKPKDITKLEAKSLNLWGMNSVDEFKAMCDTYPRNTIYYWQMESDDYCNCKVSSLVNFPRFIPASYTSFIKFVRKV